MERADDAASLEAPLLTTARSFAAPPARPAGGSRAKALQAVLPATHREPGFLAEAAKLRIDISPVSADDLLAGIAQLARFRRQPFDYMKKLLATEMGG